jgi:ABC-2 type transport system ATP-binding protein
MAESPAVETASPALVRSVQASDPLVPPAAVLDAVSRRFEDVVAVRDLSLSVPSGKILGLIGPSGSGKTTTIRMLTGALHPTTGRVQVLGVDPTRFPRRTRERIGYLPQLSVL